VFARSYLDDSLYLTGIVAVLGRGNQPLYIKTFSGEELVKLQLAVYASLDAVEEKCESKARSMSAGVSRRPDSASPCCSK
jgi:hypothetical protein